MDKEQHDRFCRKLNIVTTFRTLWFACQGVEADLAIENAAIQPITAESHNETRR